MSATLTFDYDSPLGDAGTRRLELGPTGPAGVGVPAGGTTGQVLAKSSGTDYATGWASLSITSSDISDSTAVGRSLLTAADAAAARSAIGAGTGNALTSGTLAQFAATTSAELAGVLTDETGSGSVVFSVSPTLTTPVVSGTLTVRQTGGTPGTDDATHTHDGTDYTIRNLQGGGATVVRMASSGGQFRVNRSGGSTVLLTDDNPGTGLVVEGGVLIGGSGPYVIRGAFGAVLNLGSSNGTSTDNISNLWMRSTAVISWNGDVGISRVDSNTVEINNGTRTGSGGALRGLSVSSLTATGAAIFRGTATVDATLGYGNVRCSGSTNPRLILDGGATGQVTQLDNASGTFRILSASSALVTVSSTGNLTAFGNLSTNGNLTANGMTTLGTYTVATLPSASANAGAFAQVTDSNSTTNGNTVAGGGSNRVPVFSNGTNWTIK